MKLFLILFQLSLILIRKETSNELQDQYIKSLESFGELPLENEMFDRIEPDMNYAKAMKNLQDITLCKSIGEIHDSVALLMNHISMCLFDEKNPENVMDDGHIITAFLLVIGKSSTTDLPHYVNILNKFLDNDTLNIKGVGKGINKLTFIVSNPKDWFSFIGAR